MHQDHLQNDVTPDDFDEATMRYSLHRWQMSIKKTPKNLIKAPEEFKASTKWWDFCEAFTTFMDHTKGQCDFPLSCILWDNETPPDIDEEFETREDLEEAMVPLTGAYYDEDNHLIHLNHDFLMGLPGHGSRTLIQNVMGRVHGKYYMRILKASAVKLE